MKALLKGVGLGISLVIANHLCCLLFGNYSIEVVELFSAIVFFAVTAGFLISSDVATLFGCGFSGLFVMLVVGLSTMHMPFSYHFASYAGGFWGSMAGLAAALYLTVRNISLSDLLYCEKKGSPLVIETGEKWKLFFYAVISAVTFSYLILPEAAGVSVLVFCLIQAVCLWFLIPDRKRLVLFVPLVFFGWNAFFSAATIWRISNLLLSAVLYSCLFVTFDFRQDGFLFLWDILVRLFSPFLQFGVLFCWGKEGNKGKAPIIRKVLLALLISVPCVTFLIVMLSYADMVFSMQTEEWASKLLDSINGHFLFLALLGLLAGLYLFGMIYQVHFPKKELDFRSVSIRGDLLIVNIFLSSVLVVYTLFVIIQFKYLFAGATLPYGLTYTEYARKGFFELLWLTGINLVVMLAVVKLTKQARGRWLALTKSLCHYLCAVTVILLVSSFYRMMLYTGDDGFTRLRLYVMGFLLFEALGLVATFFYIAKPKFNIVLTYGVIALTYYLLLNVVPADRWIAENQIDRYLRGECDTVSYIYTLSVDAAPAMERLYEEGTDADRLQIRQFLEEGIHQDIPWRWQRYNLSVETAKDLLMKWQ
ncbi:MAG: DUF4173 domain-containing protein [Clostridia bacterium]|nr:DUF4173 domain-containing protein [Clostridia bacterium]